jgi:tetratricopeptide (TPR) repeat protein
MAIERFEEALAIRRGIGDPGRVGAVLVDLGEAYLAAARLDEAEQAFDEAFSSLQGAEDTVELAGLFVARAGLARRRGDLARAQRELERGFLEENPDPLTRSQLHLGMAELLAAQGEYGDALAGAGRALALAGESGDRLALARGHRVRGQVLTKLGRREEALDELTAAEELVRNTSGPELVRIYRGRAEALAEADPARSREVLMRARGLQDALAARGVVLSDGEGIG